MIPKIESGRIGGWSLATCLGTGLSLLWTPLAWARPVLQLSMTVGLSVSPDYWYVVALSSAARSGPQVNLVELADADTEEGETGEEILGGQGLFVREWDYLIRVKPLDQESGFQATIEEEGSTEQEFLSEFNEVRLSRTTQPQDTITMQIDLEGLTRLNPEGEDIHVSLITVKAPSAEDPQQTRLALDTVVGDAPNYYQLSLSNIRRVQVLDPERQETVRRSREMIREEEVSVIDSIEGSSLGILAANILTFDLELMDLDP